MPRLDETESSFQNALSSNSLPTNLLPTNPLVGSSEFGSRRGFLKRVLTGATIALVGGITGFHDRVDASPELVPSTGVSAAQVGTLQVGRLKTATENFATLTIAEGDQIHALFNNTWGTPNEPHTAMIAGLSSANRFESYIAWDWPNLPTNGMPIHGYHTVYHGLDTAANVVTDSRFPFQVSQHSALKLDIPNVAVKGQGRWGLAFDTFLFKQRPFTVENVQAEIFIVLKAQDYAVPSEDSSLSSSGVAYGHGQWPGNTMTHIFWRKDNPNVPFRQTIDIYDFIRFLKNRNFASDTNILTMIDLGVEPIVGAGTFTLDSFYVTLG